MESWHIRPLAVRDGADLEPWAPGQGGRAPLPARVLLLATPELAPLTPEAAARVSAHAREVGVFSADGPGGTVLAAPDGALEALAARVGADGALPALGETLRRCVARIAAPPTRWVTHRGDVDLSRPRLMGILNVTPDSFWDGTRHPSTGPAVEAALAMVEGGADILDVGGESTRPGAEPVSAAEEIRRVVPVIRALQAQVRVPISVDTSKAEVAAAALEAGAWIVNDVWGLRAERELLDTCARWGCGLVLMHARGDSRTMGALASYRSIIGEIVAELGAAVDGAVARGVDRGRIVADPGIGFAKLGASNLTVLRHLPELSGLGVPLLVGASRKSFLQQVFHHAIEDRLEGSLAAAAVAVAGGARVVRVHDVRATRRLLDVLHGVESARWAPGGEGGR